MIDLTQYHKRRDFSRTDEPHNLGQSTSHAAAEQEVLSYVIQKHAARKLHYDFRLELDGVLLSWAVPKGPCLDPTIKRLAVEVEPHPIAYGSFEGQIDAGQYGAGGVMVWDTGRWHPEDEDPKAAYAKGHLAFSLDGQKLRGGWHLVRTRRGNSDAQWLLFKASDRFAEPGENTILEREPNSALSGRNMEQILAPKIPKSNRSKQLAKPSKAARATSSSTQKLIQLEAGNQGLVTRKKKPTARKRTQTEAPLSSNEAVELAHLPGAKPAPEPLQLEVQLATLVGDTPAGDQWLHEIKFDGYRIVAHVLDGKVKLLTRRGLNWTDRMPVLLQAFERLKLKNAIIDGEFVALDAAGVSHFQTLQNSLRLREKAALAYYAFDILHYDGFDLSGVPLVKRKALLKQVLDGHSPSKTEALAGLIRVSEHVLGNGAAFFEQACELKLEGIVSKRADGVHVSGRSRDWLKSKCSLRQEFVVLGYTQPAGSRSHFGALLVGVYEDKKLVYCGRVGTGFTEKSLAELHQKLEPLHTDALNLMNAPTGAHARGVQWVLPKLVAQVAFSGFTEEGVLRHPAFEGLREDKSAKDVTREAPQAGANTSRPQTQAEALPELDTSTVRLTHPDKVLYPDSGLTKRDLLEHAARVARLLLPHVVNRPLTLVRCPNGEGKPCFFQKHPHDTQIPGLRAVSIRGKEGKADYTALDDEQGLFALVQLGVLEIHICGALANDFEHPDILVFDLDPDPSVEFPAVIECALRLREIFQSAHLESFVKTTGGKGLHVCVPVEPTLRWDEAKAFTQRIAQALVNESPKRYVATQSKAQRHGKIFIDYLRNGRGATFVAPYSTRARPSAPVATPLFWEELTAELKPDQFTVANLAQRLASLKADPFARMIGLKQALPR